MKNKTTELHCPSCNAQGTKAIQSRICICDNTESKQDILTGSFFEWECPECSSRFFIKNPFLYNDSENKFMVYYIPDYTEASHKVPTIIKTKKEYDTQNSTLRIAINYVDFVEKIRILESGLDDRVIETVKLLYSKLTQQETDESVYSMVFESVSAKGDLRFAVFLGEKDFEAAVPYAVYEKTRADFAHLFSDESHEAFTVIDQHWVSEKLTK